MAWYEGKSCAICGKKFGRLWWWSNKPALVAPDGNTIETADLGAEEIERLLGGGHRPACWRCHLERAFRRAYPESGDKPASGRS
jgi:hypothetical protein